MNAVAWSSANIPKNATQLSVEMSGVRLMVSLSRFCAQKRKKEKKEKKISLHQAEWGWHEGLLLDVDVTDPARFLAYNSFANLSNVFWRIHEAMLAAEGRVESHAGDLIGVSADQTSLLFSTRLISKTFFTKTPAKSSWARILGLSTAVYSMLITIAAIAFPGFFVSTEVHRWGMVLKLKISGCQCVGQDCVVVCSNYRNSCWRFRICQTIGDNRRKLERVSFSGYV